LPAGLRCEAEEVSGERTLPDEFEPRKLLRRLALIVALLVVLVLVALLAPGTEEVKDRLEDARPGWLVLAVVLEALSCASYVLMFRPVFCRQMSRRTSAELALSELAVGSLAPTSGASGLALGAWVLRRGGMPADRIARRSVAFFEIKSAVNFVAVAVLGAMMAVGVVGPHHSLLLTALPAALSVAVIAGVLVLPRLGPGKAPPEGAGKLRRAVSAAQRAIVSGTGGAIELVRSGNPMLLAGAIGYWAFDNAVLWATFHAFDADIPLSTVLMGYLIGQLGGLLPLPGGVGGIDGGLIGTLVVYGAPAAAVTAAVLAYRLILFWLPLVTGGVAFFLLRRALERDDRQDLCRPSPAT
jgi:uncharacterized membrane protein YbhN (UPF0104 family)